MKVFRTTKPIFKFNPVFSRISVVRQNVARYSKPAEKEYSLFDRLKALNPFAKNLSVKFPLQDEDIITYNIYKYDPSVDDVPYIKTFYLKKKEQYPMLLSNLMKIYDQQDEGLVFRRSCREGICGSCAMNVNGQNVLACLCRMDEQVNALQRTVNVFPLPHMPIIRDLVVDMKHFYNAYISIDPYLKHREVSVCAEQVKNQMSEEEVSNMSIAVFEPEKEIYQSPEDRKLLDGLYECILCACCTTSCPSYWWNREKYLGPTILLQAYRWIIDTRDDYTIERLKALDDEFRLYRCHVILNCVKACPKHLNPAEAIANIKDLVHIMNEEAKQ